MTTHAAETGPIDGAAGDTAATVQSWVERETRARATLLAARLLRAGHPDTLCRVRNISSGGLMLETADAPAEAEAVSIELRCGRPIAGAIAWRREKQAGVRFAAPIDVTSFLSPVVNGRRRTRAHRFDTGCGAVLRALGRRTSAKLVNISQSGARIELDERATLDPGLTIAIPGLAPRRCDVRWRVGNEAGLAFAEPIRLEDLAAWLGDAGARFAATRRH